MIELLAGASLSEPHTSELVELLPTRVCVSYVLVLALIHNTLISNCANSRNFSLCLHVLGKDYAYM